MSDDAVARAREVVAARFGWIDGHADVWRLLDDGPALTAVIDALAAPYADADLTHVVGVEARGFLLGGAVARALGVGFVPVRKDGALLAGDSIEEVSAPDYRGRSWRLRLRPDQLGPGTRALLVDDWAERGSQAVAARALIERTGATYGGLSLVVDQLPATVRDALAPVRSVVTAGELPDDPT